MGTAMVLVFLLRARLIRTFAGCELVPGDLSTMGNFGIALSIEPHSQFLNDDASRENVLDDVGPISFIVPVGLKFALGVAGA